MNRLRAGIYPFAAIVGQDALKQALSLIAVNPFIGGLLVRGEKGTAKSTAVRALAALLPRIDVRRGCAFACPPDLPAAVCPHCRAQGPPETIRRQVRVINLPLNATEDRVAGGIDFSRAVKEGRRRLQPGLLAAAYRGILYVDEINLLDDHIVDVLLDAAACGENIIEREGISLRHPSRFMLVGTMNPEEGELRPQLLDRLGLCIETRADGRPEERVALMQRREAFDSDPAAFIRTWQPASEQVARRIEMARQLLPKIRISRQLRHFIASLCLENNVAGHRADMAIEQAALALAALENSAEVTLNHIQTVAPLALLHRRRDAQPPPPPPDPPDDKPPEEPPEASAGNNADETPPSEGDEQDNTPSPDDAALEPPPHPDPETPDDGDKTDTAGAETVFDIGPTFTVRALSPPKDRVFRRGSGRRSRTRIAQKQGRYVKSRFDAPTGDIALDATLRAAAPYQHCRRNDHGLCVTLRPGDVRGKIREKRIGSFLFFVVDASGSMGARGRMAASKGAVMSLLIDAYQKRDKVAMLSFRRDEAVINLPLTTSVELAGKLLAELPVGGRTPLSAAFSKTFEQVSAVLRKNPGARPIVIFITDGKSNVSLGEEKPLDEAMRLAEALGRDERVQHIVVDTEAEGLVCFGLARQLALALGAQYFRINELKARSLLDIVKQNQ